MIFDELEESLFVGIDIIDRSVIDHTLDVKDLHHRMIDRDWSDGEEFSVGGAVAGHDLESFRDYVTANIDGFIGDFLDGAVFIGEIDIIAGFAFFIDDFLVGSGHFEFVFGEYFFDGEQEIADGIIDDFIGLVACLIYITH